MNAATRPVATGVQRNILPWLALAILLHASLLLIPYRAGGERDSVYRSLALTFRPQAVRQPEAPESAARQMSEPTRPDAEARPGPQVRPEESTTALPPPEDAQTDDLPELPSTALLIDSASRFRWNRPDKREPRRLGEFTPREIPENWKSRIRIEDNRFDGAVVPERTVIVDRWLAADGSHNVVLETSTGHTLCGRAEAWDPMNPLVEHVMQFRICGGGGKRTFKMPPRYLRGNELSGAASRPRYR
ncbi:MAG: hypothetical protein KJN94_08680 [Gammaproteobacteria bacterium]|nr:hypothetical protein [Gammaproteobacteria bacterium]